MNTARRQAKTKNSPNRYKRNCKKNKTAEEQAQLKRIDRAMLWYDLENLLGEVQYGEVPDLHIDLDYAVRPFAEVEDEYLELFAKYSGTETFKHALVF